MLVSKTTKYPSLCSIFFSKGWDFILFNVKNLSVSNFRILKLNLLFGGIMKVEVGSPLASMQKNILSLFPASSLCHPSEKDLLSKFFSLSNLFIRLNFL